MGQACVLTGMVLKTAPAGEYDRRIVLLTREQGKVTAFVRGARRPKSALQAATDLFCFGKFEAYDKNARKGRNPQTDESITLPPRKVVVFRLSRKFRMELNGGEEA